MAYAKCANPEYQFEVDTLILEYTLYKAIWCQLELTACFTDDTTGTIPEARRRHTHTTAQKATDWTENFDAFISLFNLHHGPDLLAEGPQFGIHVLQFVVLLNSWCQQNGVFEGSSLQSADTMRDQLQVRKLINKAFRRHYIRSRRVAKVPPMVGTLHTSPLDTNDGILLADHIVPHFLDLSERLKSGLDLDHLINKKWFDMTAALMSRAALEKLQNSVLTGRALRNPVQTEQDIVECFAWGYYFPRMRLANSAEVIFREFESTTLTPAVTSAVQKQAEIEDNIWEMFGDVGYDDDPMQDDGSSQPTSYDEFAEWTRVRDSALSNTLKVFSALQQKRASDDVNSTATKRLVQLVMSQYPLHKVIGEVYEFVLRMFHWIYSSDRSGKPKLIQIEEGGLEDLSDGEFEEFKIRANI